MSSDRRFQGHATFACDRAEEICAVSKNVLTYSEAVIADANATRECSMRARRRGSIHSSPRSWRRSMKSYAAESAETEGGEKVLTTCGGCIIHLSASA